QVLEKWQAYQAAGEFPIPALHLAADDVLETQSEKLALQRKIGSDMRDIWAMQPRFERRTGKTPYKLLEHVRFRAGYDFMLLRCESGELDAELGEWWTAFYEGDADQREALIAAKPGQGGAAKKRPPRRGNRSKASDGGDANDVAPVETAAEPRGEAAPEGDEAAPAKRRSRGGRSRGRGPRNGDGAGGEGGGTGEPQE
ncbi:MAG TPA: polynucleotide adenylyltransferase PcnB, partial [Burkholderiaceae bacterium]